MEAARREKIYNRIKVRLTFANIVLEIILIAIFAFSGVAGPFVQLSGLAGNEYSAFLLFVLMAGFAFSIIGLPLDFYGSYIIEHRFNLSNQTFLRWIWERIKSLAVNLAIGIPVSLVFYLFLKAAGRLWWVYFGTFIFFISVFLARIAPVLIFPLFYKFTEIPDGETRGRILKIMSDAGIGIKGIFSFNLSKDTKKANAGFTGIGRSKRIILSDTLLEKFSPREIAVIFAHETGHYVHGHILKNIAFGTVVIFTTFYICGNVYSATISHMGYEKIYDLRALPVLMFYLSVFGMIMMPLNNYISRVFEFQADDYAVRATGDSESFISSMDKLAELNLADRDPHPAVEFFLYSHPSIRRRIERAGGLQAGIYS